MQPEPLVSILTPTWNRVNYLERVWKGINNQTYKQIEWIVCNDGSTDSTENKLKELYERSKFPIKIISSNVHIGKARMDNEAILIAEGKFIVWNDSDDYLLPNAIERLVQTWNLIPESERRNYVGVTAQCSSEEESNVSLSNLSYLDDYDLTWNDLREKFNVTGDMLYFFKAEILKNYKFPEVDFVIPEGYIWTELGNHKKTRILPEILQIKQYRAEHCISFSNKMEYSRGRAYALAEITKNLKKYKKTYKKNIWLNITFIRYCLHGDINLKLAKELWGNNSSSVIFYLVYPIALATAKIDILQKKVIKTHIEFESAAKKCIISINKIV